MRTSIVSCCIVMSFVSAVFAGSGTENDPYTIAEARALSEGATEYYAQGYIVGGRYDDFEPPCANDYAVSCADSDSETEVNNCLQVKLESDGGRANWGLNSNPGNLGKRITFKGFRDSYGGYPSFEGVNYEDIGEVTGGGASNEPPTLSIAPSGTNKAVTASNTLTFVMSAEEPTADAADQISLSADSLPSGASFSTVIGTTPLTNTFSWTPTVGQVGTHTVTFRAEDADGANTLTVRITVSEPGAVTYHAVICGISDYDGSINDLDYCDDDAQDIYNKLLESPHWQAGNMQLLLDAQATEANIQTALSSMGSRAGANDVCLFFFSGHGYDPTDVYPYDEADGYDEALCTYYIDSNEILDDELGDWLGDLPTDHIVVWLDTCFSGGHLKTPPAEGRTVKRRDIAGGNTKKGDGFIADLLDGPLKDVNDLASPYISTACDDDEYSYEDHALDHGVYTYYLLQALDNADADGDAWVSAEETFDYLYSRVVTFESTQHPQEVDLYAGEAEVASTNVASGPMPASITITSPAGDLTVQYSNTLVSLSGNCNTATVGVLSWTNALTGATGARAAATSWTISSIALGVGANTITVRGANKHGAAASDSITVTRRAETAGNVLIDEDFDDSTDAPAGWTDNGSANDTLASHVQSSPHCRAMGSGDTLDTPAVDAPTEISFFVDSSNGGEGQDGELYYQIDGGSWALLHSFTVGTDGATETVDLTGSPDLSGERSVKFRFSSDFYTWYLDDVLVLGGSSGSGIDDDGDWIPNWWENLHSGGNTNLDAHADNDGDGCNNLHEWIADCDPTNAWSVFTFRAETEAGVNGAYRIYWNSASNRLYDIHWSASISAPFSPVATNIPATPPLNVYTDRTHGAEASVYYRIDARME